MYHIREVEAMFYRVEKSGCVFEQESYRVKVDGVSKVMKRKKCIGKMDESGHIVPNAYYRERLEKEDLEKKLAAVQKSVAGQGKTACVPPSKDRTDELLDENRRLRAQVEELTKRIDELSAERTRG
jgi:hypothetical protein